MSKEKLFAKETDLCAAFISALPSGCTPYAETAGWDILLVRDSDGLQIGIEAKLKLNVDVVNQAIENRRPYQLTREMPDFRAVLVPFDCDGKLSTICTYLGITVIQVKHDTWRKGKPFSFTPSLPKVHDELSEYGREEWFETCTAERHKLPKYVPDVPAGASGPIQLTKWKEAALHIAVTLEVRGYVTREDFKHHKIDHRRWVAGGWIRACNGVYVKGDGWPLFEQQHPRVYGEIKANADAWLPSVGKLVALA